MKTKLKGMDFITVRLMYLSLKNNNSFEDVLKFVLRDFGNRSQKSQLKKKLTNWHDNYVKEMAGL